MLNLLFKILLEKNLCSSFGGLRQRDAVAGVTARLRQAGDLRGHAVGNCLACGVIGCAVDFQARRQAFDRGAQAVLRGVQVLLSDHGRDVGIDN